MASDGNKIYRQILLKDVQNLKYILNNIALRSWRLVPHAYYSWHQRNANGLSKEEFDMLLLCDGQQDIEDGELISRLLKRGLCRAAENGEQLTEWQRLKVCDNRYFPAVNWMITGKCNYNCLHCFNAADNTRLQSEFTAEEAEEFICEAERCGINAFTITGGEPMVHPNLLEIVRSIYNHGGYVNELNTNGSFLTQEILDEMRSIGCSPLMKISFDGIGYHDWLRNREGAEEDALRAIKLCIDNGFEVMSQTNVHRHNIKTMLPTAKLLDEMGVQSMRIIRTTEAPRWKDNAGDSCLALSEYFESMLEFASEYVKTDCRMDIDIWQFIDIFPKTKSYRPRSIECNEGEYRDSIPVCRGNRGMAAVGANGNLYPCHQMSGYYDKQGDVLGNVKEQGLQPLLQEGRYLCEVCTTVRQLKEHNEECAACEWFKYCCGGCRAIGLALTGDKLGCDLSKCLFFKGGYLDRVEAALDGYKSLAFILKNKA